MVADTINILNTNRINDRRLPPRDYLGLGELVREKFDSDLLVSNAWRHPRTVERKIVGWDESCLQNLFELLVARFAAYEGVYMPRCRDYLDWIFSKDVFGMTASMVEHQPNLIHHPHFTSSEDLGFDPSLINVIWNWNNRRWGVDSYISVLSAAEAELLDLCLHDLPSNDDVPVPPTEGFFKRLFADAAGSPWDEAHHWGMPRYQYRWQVLKAIRDIVRLAASKRAGLFLSRSNHWFSTQHYGQPLARETYVEFSPEELRDHLNSLGI